MKSQSWRFGPGKPGAAKGRRPTLAAGALIEKRLILGWVARQSRKGRADLGDRFEEGFRRALADLKFWLAGQPARTARRGGIGR